MTQNFPVHYIYQYGNNRRDMWYEKSRANRTILFPGDILMTANIPYLY